jgi:tetratricopeptide (TPR) repeat protein
MKLSAKLTLFVACATLGACGTLPFGPAPKPVAKPKPRPPVSTPTPPPSQPNLIPAQPSAATAPATSTPAAPVAPIVVDKGDPDARFKQALELLKQNQPQDAETALVDLSKDFPQFSGPFADLGIVYAKSKRVQPAIQAFTRAAIANPQNALAYNWLGILLRESNDYVRAEQAYKKALSINPNHVAANLNLGILYDAYMKRPQDALPYYKNYLRLGGQDDLRVLVWIAQIEKTSPSAPKPRTQGALSGPPSTLEKKP